MLKGLKGDADNGDKVITVGELHDYIRKNVLDTTKNLYSNLPQTPQLYTENPDRVLLRLPQYRQSKNMIIIHRLLIQI